MAVQFGFAWSSIIKGVGVGGPFYCAQASAAAMRRIDWAVELMSEKAREQPAFPHRSVPIHRTVQKSTLVNFTVRGWSCCDTRCGRRAPSHAAQGKTCK